MNCLQVELNFNATANFRNAPELNIYTRCQQPGPSCSKAD